MPSDRSIPSQRLLVPLLVALLGAGGCVTTETGGLPAPAAKERRVQAQLDLARALLSERKFDRARDPLDRALKIDDESVEAHVLYAVLSDGEGEPEIAEKYYRKAIRLGPENAQALSNYGAFLIARARTDEALPLLERAVQDTGYVLRSQAYENLGIARQLLGDRAAAQMAFARAVSLNRGQARSNLELAEMALADGKAVDARELLNNYRAVASQTPRSLCLGIQAAQQLGDADSLASNTIALKNLFPDSTEARRCTVQP
ncbi:MAG: type IV pilus biogenesis/stability protein PilW [Pseudomonadota bacterium]